MSVVRALLCSISILCSVAVGAQAENDWAKLAQEKAEELQGKSASVWLVTKRIPLTDEPSRGASQTTRLSRDVFAFLNSRGKVGVAVSGSEGLMDVAINGLSDFIDDEKPSYVSAKGRTLDFLRLGIFDAIAVLDVEKANDPDCEWIVTFRGWIEDVTIIGEAVAHVTAKDGGTDGYKFQRCYRVGRNGLEDVWEEFAPLNYLK